ncbi:hypothetical protein C8J56DRAFT_1164166 [Mycena floridula]|nr:hypothetical protein C8J56DRAFT_1164166 [Mycena floridula]
MRLSAILCFICPAFLIALLTRSHVQQISQDANLLNNYSLSMFWCSDLQWSGANASFGLTDCRTLVVALPRAFVPIPGLTNPPVNRNGPKSLYWCIQNTSAAWQSMGLTNLPVYIIEISDLHIHKGKPEYAER